MLIQKIIDLYKPVKGREKQSSKCGNFQRNIMAIQNRSRIDGFIRKKLLNTCKPESKRKNIEQTQINNSCAELNCKSLSKLNLAKKQQSNPCDFLPKFFSVQSYLFMGKQKELIDCYRTNLRFIDRKIYLNARFLDEIAN